VRARVAFASLPERSLGPLKRCGKCSNVHRSMVVANVDSSLFPLASLDSAGEEDIDLAVRATLQLGEPVPRHGQADGSSTGPDVTTLGSEVGSLSSELLLVICWETIWI